MLNAKNNYLKYIETLLLLFAMSAKNYLYVLLNRI